ncbi:NLR family CARD domain-containing protein 4-like [Anneissia japonica]|uniref:NLR family CARD domain-containing protein 4-like n=1 Tax=Anneissia japonica TaxID=1529436 RepID=UPI00142596DF|nr:NLR family CARD domain-containing protein 4-like [Anneissia japonica]
MEDQPMQPKRPRDEESQSQATGAAFQMDSGASIQNLNMTIQQHIYGPSSSLTDQEISRCRDDLKSYYRSICKIRLLPWLKRDLRNRLEIKDLYTNLYLICEMPNAIDLQVHIKHYSEILTSTPGEGMRALIRGKAGAGKTTLLEKIALEWADGKLPPSYNDKPLLFLLKMKRISDNDTLIDAAFRQGLFGHDLQKLKSKLSDFVEDNPKEVIVLLDALDEYSGYNSGGYIDSIIHNDSMRCASVIVTTRPWRAFEVLDKSPDTYSSRNYEVKGYTQVQVNEYVNRFFVSKADIGKHLLSQLRETGLDIGIATIPIMCMLICVVFRELRAVLPRTMSELYEKLHDFLIRHYDEDKDSETKVCKTDQLNAIEKLGKLAFSGLLQNKLSFEENDFNDTNILENACRIGLVVHSNYINNMPDDDLCSSTQVDVLRCCLPEEEKHCYEFFHKTFQEWYGASYLAKLSKEDIGAFEQSCKPVYIHMISCLDKELLLRFLSGARPMDAAELVIRQLVIVFLNSPDLLDYKENKLDLQKTRIMQEFIELILRCNRESQSEGKFNALLNEMFEKQCCARFTNITSTTLQAIGYMLKFGGATNESSRVDCKLRIRDLKISCYSTGTDGDIDHLWGEFQAVGEQYKAKCKTLSDLPRSKLESIFEQVKDILPKGIEHLQLASKLAFADTCEFMQKWKGDYSHICSVVENIRFSEITNLTINGIDLSDHCAILCRSLKNMKSLKKLDLGSTSLKAMHCRFIGEMLESLSELCILNLNKNKLEDISDIVQRLKYLPCLTRLDLETTHLTTSSIAALGQNLKYVRKLERFYIRSSPLHNGAVEDLVSGLYKVSDLIRLNITLGGKDQLSYENITILVKCLSAIQNIELLFIDGLFSPIIDNVFLLLATDLLPSLKKLKSLRLQGRLGLSLEEAKHHAIGNATAKVFARNLNTNSLPNLMALRLIYLWVEKEGLEAIRTEVRCRIQENNSFQFELYPNDDNEGDSAYVPQAVLLSNLNPASTKE